MNLKLRLTLRFHSDHFQFYSPIGYYCQVPCLINGEVLPKQLHHEIRQCYHLHRGIPTKQIKFQNGPYAILLTNLLFRVFRIATIIFYAPAMKFGSDVRPDCYEQSTLRAPRLSEQTNTLLSR